MNKIIKSLMLGAVLAITATGCTDGFNDMNIDPNNPTPETVDPKFQLIYAQSRSIMYSSNWQQSDQLVVSTFCEYSANDGLSASDYSVDSRYVQGLWDLSYVALTNFNSIIRNGQKYNNIAQISKICRVYVMQRLTDCIGDIPYSEAAAGISKPKYDTQQEVYNNMFNDLTDAYNALDASAPNNIGVYDLIYGGDIAKWKIFAASLRLRLALRIADVDETKARAEIATAISQGVMSSDADAALLAQGTKLNELSSQNPIYFHKGASVIHMSTAYLRLVTGLGGQAWPTAADKAANPNIKDNILTAINAPATVDPRAPIHFEPSGVIETVATPSLNGQWNGTDPGNVSSGVGASMINGQFVSDFSKIGPFFYETADRKYPIMKYSEVCFLKAIAVERGLMAGDAKAFYEAGIKSSMNEFGIPADKITAYLASKSPNYHGTTVNYDDKSGTTNTALDKILTQKYIAQFQECSFETWSDHRQYHKPTLMPFASVSSSVFIMNPSDQANNTPAAYIKRIYYPSSETTVNNDNLQEAYKRMGGKDFEVQKNVWWDVK